MHQRNRIAATGDSDADGVCDDIDACVGFDDTLDADGDRVPDGCDVCNGFDDTVDLLRELAEEL